MEDTRVCSYCKHAKPISEFQTQLCSTCTPKRRQQWRQRKERERILIKDLQRKNEELGKQNEEQKAEAKRLAAVLTAFRAPEAISDQHLHQLWKHPEDSLAICPLLPSAPEAEPQNCSAQPAETLDPPLDLDLFAVSFLDDKGKKSI